MDISACVATCLGFVYVLLSAACCRAALAAVVCSMSVRGGAGGGRNLVPVTGSVLVRLLVLQSLGGSQCVATLAGVFAGGLLWFPFRPLPPP